MHDLVTEFVISPLQVCVLLQLHLTICEAWRKVPCNGIPSIYLSAHKNIPGNIDDYINACVILVFISFVWKYIIPVIHDTIIYIGSMSYVSTTLMGSPHHQRYRSLHLKTVSSSTHPILVVHFCFHLLIYPLPCIIITPLPPSSLLSLTFYITCFISVSYKVSAMSSMQSLFSWFWK